MGTVADFRTAASALVARMGFANWAGITFRGMRDLYQVLGYKRDLDYWDYRDRYARDGVAKAVVDAYPDATWRGGVEVYEDEDPKTDTEFEKAFKALDLQLSADSGNGFWETCHQVDVLAGLSTYAVLLIGVSGDSNLSSELPRGERLLFLKPYVGGGGPGVRENRQRSTSFMAAARIARYEVDPTSKRFGEPASYYIRNTTPGSSFLNYEVHWSRVIHVAEGCLEDNVFGAPRLECVYNLFDDLAKVTGGGAEAYWLRANQGLHVDVDKDLGLPNAQGQITSQPMGKEERELIRDKFEELQHQLQRVIVTRGTTVTQLGSDVANIGPNADALLKQIAGAARIPMRLLTGSEMGTLASEQDAANFDSRVQDRRTGYAGPKIVRRTLDRLIAYDYLPTPKEYFVGWPVEENMDEKGKADFALSLANVNKTYGAPVFDDGEIRDMSFHKPPLVEVEPWKNLTELDKATLAAKLALVNKEMGVTVYTDDEIRKMSHGLAPLTDAQKVPISAPEKISAGTPPPLGADGLPVNPALLVAQLKALEAAIERDDLEAIGKILALSSLPDGAQKFTIAKNLTRAEALVEARKRAKGDFRGVKYDATTGELKLLAEYELSTTQVQLPDSFLGFGLKIPDSDLAEGGRETDPHVTLKYGLHTNSAEPVRAALAGRGPITFTLGKTDYFAADDHDVLFVEVRSEDLKRLNAYVASTLDVTDTQPRYIPHATVAYLKSGLGEKYAGDTAFQGQQHVASSVTFSNADGERTVISVG